MNEDDKKIYSMVQRLSHLDKVSISQKKAKEAEKKDIKTKREEKVQEKRDAYSKENRKDRYKKAQGGRNQGGNKFGGKK